MDEHDGGVASIDRSANNCLLGLTDVRWPATASDKQKKTCNKRPRNGWIAHFYYTTIQKRHLHCNEISFDRIGATYITGGKALA
jgi:hypothetical protein